MSDVTEQEQHEHQVNEMTPKLAASQSNTIPMAYGRTPTQFEKDASKLRIAIKDVAKAGKLLLVGTTDAFRRESASNRETDGRTDEGEVLANLTLAYRHLEDASMRVGKAIQASDGGVSVYDRATTVGA